ncbi:MAG TPA: YraN family protein [Candidatus Paceibacterota bacterium]|nr:YraN family protein [Candidatus Paceibacterota bacterium]HMP19017.1 YraN family protein [Candidatus Paceibacterota bacterium]
MGEFWAKMFLMKHDFVIISQNYYCRYGELDLVALKQNIIHFVEVKSVSRETFFNFSDYHFVGENFDHRKLNKIKKTILFFTKEKNLNNYNYQIDLICVTFIKGQKIPILNYNKNII